MPSFEETETEYDYSSSPPGLDFPGLVPDEPQQWDPELDEAVYQQWPEYPFLPRFTPPIIGSEARGHYQHTAVSWQRQRRLLGVLPGNGRRSVGPSPELVLSGLATERESEHLPSEGEVGETDSAVPAGTLRPWEECGWVPNEDEPEPELAEFFYQDRASAISSRPVAPRGRLTEVPLSIDYNGRVIMWGDRTPAEHVSPDTPVSSTALWLQNALRDQTPDYEEDEYDERVSRVRNPQTFDPTTIPASTLAQIERVRRALDSGI